MATLEAVKKVDEYQLDNSTVIPDNANDLFLVTQGPVLLWKYFNSSGKISPIETVGASSGNAFNVNCSRYKYLIIKFVPYYSTDYGCVEQMVYLNPQYTNKTFSGGTVLSLMHMNDSGLMSWRQITIASAASFNIAGGGYCISSGTTYSDNNRCIPIEIWATNIV